MNPILIPFRRRWFRFLFALGYAVVAAYLLYDTPLVLMLEAVLLLLLYAALFIRACTLCYRYTIFLIRREYLRLDNRGITLWHNALTKQRELHLPWDSLLGTWTDEVHRRTRTDYLSIAWKVTNAKNAKAKTGNAAGAAQVALNLKYARGSDHQGNRLRGAALGEYLVKRISARIPPAPVRLEKSANTADVAQEIWYFRAPEAAFNRLPSKLSFLRNLFIPALTPTPLAPGEGLFRIQALASVSCKIVVWKDV